MAAHTTNDTGTGTPIPPALRVTNDLNDALTTWSTSQRTVIGLAADFAESGEWTATGAVSAAHWIAGVADIEVCTAREWIRVGRRLRALPLRARGFDLLATGRRPRFTLRSVGGGTLQIAELLAVLGEPHLNPHFELRRKS